MNTLENANPVKKLCELGICKSMAEARRLVSILDSKRISQIIEKAQSNNKLVK